MGYEGQYSLKGPLADLERAKAEFNKKLKDKQKSGYIELEIVFEEEKPQEQEVESKQNTQDEDSKRPVEHSKLDQRVQDFINLIFDLKAMNQVLAEIGYDSKKMPLGKLSSNHLKQGLEILKDIEAVLENREDGELDQLSSKFYSLIPHDFGFRRMSEFVINSKEKLKEKISMINSLTDMKIATKILESKSVGAPVDEHYSKLNAHIEPIDRNDPLFSILSDYVKNTHAKTHSSYSLSIMDIFRVQKEEEEKQFLREVGNNMLL